jgi:molybdenum cofactor biosynthesis enzyme MoaA
VCRAPLVTLEFDAFGDVQACCANALFPLGSVMTSTIDEIWHGPRIRTLRDALAQGDLSLGCSVCRHRLATSGAELPLEAYNSFPMPEGVPEWPHRLSFSLHNTCNLECVMCGADRSSKIRSRRAGLDPLPHRYGSRFFEQLVPYLRHASLIDFVGGEPFLVREHWRIWELLEELDVRPRCAVTTNATVWNDRVEHVLSVFPTDVFVSIDGCTRETFERIRVGASFDEVYRNLDRFRAYAAERGTYLAINWSFVRHNWRELPSMLRWAEERDLPVNVMTVIEPEHGVQRLPDEELDVVVATMDAWDVSLARDLDRNLAVWRRQLTMVRTERDRRRRNVPRQALMEPAAEVDLERIASTVLALADQPAPPHVADRRSEAWTSLQRWGVDHRRGGLVEGCAPLCARWLGCSSRRFVDALPELSEVHRTRGAARGSRVSARRGALGG